MEDGYFVKWEKHHNAIFTVFDNLYKHNVLVDCTLAAEDKFIKVHRIVLMACSDYFEELLSQHIENYPIVWLNMKYSELHALVEFCYRGEVKLCENELPGFLNAARSLHIKGLCHSEGKRKKGEDGLISGKRRRITDPESGNNHIKLDNNNEAVDGRTEDLKYGVTIQNGGDLLENSLSRGADSDNSDVDTDDESSSGEGEVGVTLEEIIRGGNSQYIYRWACNRCGEAFPTRNAYSEHRRRCFEVRGDHAWACHKCPMTYKNKKDLVRHLNYCGIPTERHVCERCGNTYKYERGLKRHKIYCGTDLKPLVCSKCGKTYKYKRGLRRHQKQLCGLDQEVVKVSTGNSVVPAIVQRSAPSSTGTDPKSPTPPLSNLPLSTVSDQLKSPKEEIMSAPTAVTTTAVSTTTTSSTSTAVSQTPEESASSGTSQTLSEHVCKNCGKMYKYRKSYMSHVESCVGQIILGDAKAPQGEESVGSTTNNTAEETPKEREELTTKADDNEDE